MCRIVVGLVVLGIACSLDALAETVMVPMRDGVRLATEVRLPEGGGPKFPVVLVRTVYGRNSDNFAQGVISRGMAAVIQDTRGHGDSEGQKMLFQADGWGALRDGEDTLAWVKSQPWCNGKMGTWGVSALGITQVLLAPTTDELACQVIGLAPASLFPVFMRGGVPQKQLSERYAARMGHEAAFEERRKHLTYDEHWRRLDPERRSADVTAPAVHVGGWFDLYPQGAIDNFVSRQYLGGPGARGNQKLIMGPWEHGITETVGDLRFPGNKFNWSQYAWRFVEHWLKGAADGIMDEPSVYYYVMGDCHDPKAPGNHWRTATAWPPFPTVATSYFLVDGGALTKNRPDVRKAKRTYTFDPADPCPSLGGDNAMKPLPLDQRPNSSRGDVLLFTTEPLDEPLEVTGPVRVKLFVSSDAPDTDFAAKIVDIYPDGRQIAILSGIQRVKYRHGVEKAEPLPPGSIDELVIDCWSTSIIFNKAHRIGLLISSSDWPRYEVNPNTGQDLPAYNGKTDQGDLVINPNSVRVAHNTVFMDASRASELVLPVRPAEKRDKPMTTPSHDGDRAAQQARGPRLTKPRIDPVRKEAWTAEQKQFLEPLEQAGRLYNVFKTMANHPDLARDWMTFASYILRRSSLPPRDREVLILRIGWLCKAEYEWAQHMRVGKNAGLTDDDVRRISEGPTAAGLTDHDRLLLQAADELHDDAMISDATWTQLAKSYSTQQMMDVVFTIGQYNLVSMALNSFGVQLDEGLEGFSKGTQ
jgi:predicted acyl esterase/alkylhydroperoxidase family enzyme